MTTVLINAISVKEGGSLVVLRELLAEMCRLRPDWRWHVVLNSQLSPGRLEAPGVQVHAFPEIDQSGWKVRLWYESGLPKLVREIRCDLLYSQTNYLPSRHLPCRTLLLEQHAGHFSTLFGALTEARLGFLRRLDWRLKGRWVRGSLRRADAVTVQTQALAERIEARLGLRPRVIPHGTGLAGLRDVPARPPAEGEAWRIGYLTKFGVQKNFAVLFDAAARLRAAGLDLRLVLTLSREARENDEVFALARQAGVEPLIENHGEIAIDAMPRLYDSLHLFVFPSLCESFGFPMLEAMARGIPLLVADIDSNLEVAAEGGLGFPRHDAAALAARVLELVQTAGAYQAQAHASLGRARRFSWQQAAGETIALMEALLNVKQPPCRRAERDSGSATARRIALRASALRRGFHLPGRPSDHES